MPEFYRPDSYQRGESLGWLLKRVQQSIAQQAGLRLAKDGLTHAQWVPLLILRLGGPSPVASLARELETDTGAMTRLLDRLEAKGLCLRERSSEDRRVVMVSLTEEGMTLTSKLTAVLADVFNAHLQGFSEAEWRLLLSLLQRLIANGDALRQAEQG
ncbi:MarR family winged helix-turn-helix transcriptional regulator [Roseateles violae]|uniref:MarR family transcriptional regulator n=1 Tax=Roseateles violae TaxID=3058042 RepID=A0ABT8DRE6_9BURK|nr:MarR family transcriptional regulator [Pelomonas sp. PFR6]MDN3920601.1 MarR family transcriptional regulator [Pelomonas sp. PFR6]